ncbi:MAG: IgGFc-binding protein [Fibrobacterales bacterium]
MQIFNVKSINTLKITLKFEYLFIAVLFFMQVGYTQISNKHYLPPIFGVGSNVTEFKIVLTTIEKEPFEVTIENGDGTFEESVTISFENPQEVYTPKIGAGKKGFLGFPMVDDSHDTNQDQLLEYLNTPLPDHGFILKADKPFFANYMAIVPSQGEILTSKGKTAIGREFYAGYQHMNYVEESAHIKSHFTSVMALQDDTEVEFYNSRILYYGQNEKRFTVTLNKGESYIVGNSAIGIKEMCGESDECMNGYNGTKITATDDIVVNSGSVHGGYDKRGGMARDIGFDQIVPVEYSGKEFIVVEGNGGEDNSTNEVVIVIATEDDTEISINGKSTVTLKNEGDYTIIPWEEYDDYTMYLNADKNIYVYQTLAGNTSAVSPGMMFIPRLSTSAAREVLISGLGMFFKNSTEDTDQPSMFIVTQKNAELTINTKTVPQDSAKSIAGTGNWVAYRITDLSPYGKRDDDIYATSTHAMAAAVTFISKDVGGGGYYSGFTEIPSKVGLGDLGVKKDTISCAETIDLFAKDSRSYTWTSFDDDHMELLEKENDSTYIFLGEKSTGPGPYVYRVITEYLSQTGAVINDTADLSVYVQCSNIESASIHDVDGDGIGETIRIVFDNPVTTLQDDISSIDWPEEGKNDRTVSREDVKIESDSDTEITLYLPDAFNRATGADEDNPPTLEYNGQKILIDDSLPPVIILATKKPARYYQYAVEEDDSLTYYIQSDTLLVYTSEEVVFDKKWDKLFVVDPKEGDEYKLRLKEKPFYRDGEGNSSELVLVIDPEKVRYIPKVGDEISLSTSGQISDALNNIPHEQFVTIEGRNGKRQNYSVTFRNPVVGVEQSPAYLTNERVPVYDADGELLEEKELGRVYLTDQWVTPVQFKDGALDKGYQCDDDDEDDERDSDVEQSTFDFECYASLVLGTYEQEGAYSTTIYVFDQLGQFVDTWTQTFGQCGEFENEHRQSLSNISGIIVNDLVWDLKGYSGRRVGAGVYTWQIVTTFESGTKIQDQRSMGVLRINEECR